MGTYTVVITTADGCTTTIAENIAPESCLIPKGISPNNDRYNYHFDLKGHRMFVTCRSSTVTEQLFTSTALGIPTSGMVSLNQVMNYRTEPITM